MCNCLHVMPSEMVPPRHGVIYLHCMVLLDQGDFRLLSSCAELEFCRQAGGVLLMLGLMMVNWKYQGYPKQLWLFILLVCIQCSLPALRCVMKIRQWGSDSHPTLLPFICLSLRDCFCPSLNPLYYQPLIFLGTLILSLHSPSNKNLSLCLSLLMQFLALSFFSRFLLGMPVMSLWSASYIGCGWPLLSLCSWGHKTLLGCHSHVCSIIL